MSEDLQAMAERIRSCMKDEKLKQSDIVKTTGVSKSSVSKWLSGKARPTGKYLLRLSQVLNQTEDWILNGDNPCYPGYDDDFNIDYDYENIKDSKDYYNRDYLIKTLVMQFIICAIIFGVLFSAEYFNIPFIQTIKASFLEELNKSINV
mgnify:CR=1 FL=1